VVELKEAHPQTYRRHPQAARDKSIDAFSVARPTTGTRWRASGPARRAKHDQREAVLTQHLRGAELIEAAQKYHRVVHHGTE
jgi:hypothetical protein